MVNPIFFKLLSESLLSFYPTLVKLIDLPLNVQMWSRLFIYSLLSFFFIDRKFIGEMLFTKSGILASVINFLHIYTSYKGFQLLPSGISYSIFYVYPIIILLLSGTGLNVASILGFLGVLLITTSFSKNEDSSFGKNEDSNSATNETEKEKALHYKLSGFDEEEWLKKAGFETTDKFMGIFYILLAALTEAFLYFIVKGIETTNSWNHVFLSYFLGMIGISALNYKDIRDNFKVDSAKVWNLLLANGVIGALGYFMRFYSVSRISPMVYAMLSYIGIVMSYIYGYLFSGEKVNLKQVIGTVIIIGSNIMNIMK